LCNASVDFLMRNDRTGRLRFASFQSDEGAALLRAHGVTTAPETIYVVDNGRLYSESDAALYLTSFLRAPYRILSIGKVVPRFIRNALYRIVARNRYRWFGKKDSCRIPTPEERSRFL
jgi:predicted DCC family thiol-disulfide oxidoreductase YuxK